MVSILINLTHFAHFAKKTCKQIEKNIENGSEIFNLIEGNYSQSFKIVGNWFSLVSQLIIFLTCLSVKKGE